MRQLGLLGLDVDLVPSPASYGSIPGNPLTWDADTVYGCYCDWMVRDEYECICTISRVEARGRENREGRGGSDN